MRVLVLKLEAPLASFGDVAVNETRPTSLHPLKSMMAGLLANALGYRRENPADVQRLQDGLLMASRADRPSRRLLDYQIAFKSDRQVCTETGRISFLHKENVWTSRPVETGSFDGNMQLYKHYLADISCTVALNHRDERLLLECAEAVRKPARPIFLGRKGCAPSRPLYEDLVECGSLVEALHRVPPEEEECPVRTEPSEASLLGNRTVLLDVHDLKDWDSGLHMTARQVAEALVTFGASS